MNPIVSSRSAFVANLESIERGEVYVPLSDEEKASCATFASKYHVYLNCQLLPCYAVATYFIGVDILIVAPLVLAALALSSYVSPACDACRKALNIKRSEVEGNKLIDKYFREVLEPLIIVNLGIAEKRKNYTEIIPRVCEKYGDLLKKHNYLIEISSDPKLEMEKQVRSSLETYKNYPGYDSFIDNLNSGIESYDCFIDLEVLGDKILQLDGRNIPSTVSNIKKIYEMIEQQKNDIEFLERALATRNPIILFSTAIVKKVMSIFESEKS